MRPPVPALALAILAAALGGVAVWIAIGSTGWGGAPVGFPAEARGVVGSSDGPVPEPGGAPVSLTVEVVPRALLQPVQEELPQGCRLLAGDGTELGVRSRILAGARAAVPEARVGGRHLVAFEEPGGGSSCRVVELDPDAVVDVLATTRASLRGRVLTGDGAAVVGAWVWAGKLAADGSLVAAVTDVDGRFEFDGILGGPGVPLAVRASGFASRYRLLDLSYPARDEVDVTLDPSVALDVVFGAPVAEPGLGRVALAPAGGDVALLHYPFFLGGLLGEDRLRPDGTASFADLPAGSTVEVRVVHPESRERGAVTVRLRRARQRAVVAGAAAEILEGSVRDPDGAPVVGAAVVAWTGLDGDGQVPAHVGSLLAVAAHAPRAVRTATAADGSFRIGRPGADGACRVAVRAARRPGLVQQVAASRATVRHDFVLPDPVEFAPPAVVRVHLRAEGRAVRARRSGATFVRWRDLEPFEVRLAEPALADVRIVVLDSGEAHERVFRAVAVAGTVDLHLDL